MKAYARQQLPYFLCSSIVQDRIHERLKTLGDLTDVLIKECFHEFLVRLRKVGDDACKNNYFLSKLIDLFRNSVNEYMNEKESMVRKRLQE
jgi:hypothetical protein